MLEINGIDLTEYLAQGFKCYPNTMVTNEERNAKGRLNFDIVATKVKIEAPVLPLKLLDVQKILNAVSSYVVTARYRDIRTNTLKTISAYVPDLQPELDYRDDKGIFHYKSFLLTVIEM